MDRDHTRNADLRRNPKTLRGLARAMSESAFQFRVPGYSSSESYGEKQKLIGFKGSRAHRSKLGS